MFRASSVRAVAPVTIPGLAIVSPPAAKVTLETLPPTIHTSSIVATPVARQLGLLRPSLGCERWGSAETRQTRRDLRHNGAGGPRIRSARTLVLPVRETRRR